MTLTTAPLAPEGALLHKIPHFGGRGQLPPYTRQIPPDMEHYFILITQRFISLLMIKIYKTSVQFKTSSTIKCELQCGKMKPWGYQLQNLLIS